MTTTRRTATMKTATRSLSLKTVAIVAAILVAGVSAGHLNKTTTTDARKAQVVASLSHGSSLGMGQCLEGARYKAHVLCAEKKHDQSGAPGGESDAYKAYQNEACANSTVFALQDAEGYNIFMDVGGTCGVTNVVNYTINDQQPEADSSYADFFMMVASKALEVAGDSLTQPYAPICRKQCLHKKDDATGKNKVCCSSAEDLLLTQDPDTGAIINHTLKAMEENGKATCAVNDCAGEPCATVCGKVMVMEREAGDVITRFDPGYTPSECGDGLFVPLIPGEMSWSNWVRIIFYALGMIYCFLGVSIIADKFMVAIEVITAKEVVRKVKLPDGTLGERKYLVWNETLANLSLMALGSSAPEILLAVIEACGDLANMKEYDKVGPPDGLGPSCIVGSAAFNLLVISAVCVASVPSTENRKIMQFGVYLWTAFFSLFAYVWLLLVLQYISPGVVEVWEAIVTFLCFPLLLFLAYAQDKNWWRKKSTSQLHKTQSGTVIPEDEIKSRSSLSNMTPEGTAKILVNTAAYTGGRRISSAALTTTKYQDDAGHAMQEVFPDMTGAITATMKHEGVNLKDCDPEDLAKLAAAEVYSAQHHSALHYRIQGARMLTGTKRNAMNVDKKAILADIKRKREAKLDAARAKKRRELEQGQAGGESKGEAVPLNQLGDGSDPNSGDAIITFGAVAYEVYESEPTVELHVFRMGNQTVETTVYYETSNGTAFAGEDYHYASGKLVFAPGENEKEVVVKIIDDNEYEPDENFFCTLRKPENGVLGKTSVAEVTIINDDDPGHFGFLNPTVAVPEAEPSVEVDVKRVNGVDGTVKLKYKTVDGTAKAGVNYVAQEGELDFLHQEVDKKIEIKLINTNMIKDDEIFYVDLEIVGHGTEAVGADYSEDHARQCQINLTVDKEAAEVMNAVNGLVAAKLAGLSIGTRSYRQQFADAVTVQAEEEGEDAGRMDYIMHFLTLGWKIIFAFTPPTDYCGGWATFVVSLGFIGLLTGFVGDIADIFGCTIGMPTAITAITFVALGTSLPDTFASMSAANQSPTADASVGNVTGSNSVNVFLGLGIPWLISSFYAMALTRDPDHPDYVESDTSTHGVQYKVKYGNLGFTVIAFLGCAIVCMAVLFLRRAKSIGGELGGPSGPKWATAILFTALWFVFVALSAWNTIKGMDDKDKLLKAAWPQTN